MQNPIPKFRLISIISEKTEHPFVDISKWKTCAKFQPEVFNPTLVGARQSFQFFQKNTWFHENNGALPKFLYRILHYLISITKL